MELVYIIYAYLNRFINGDELLEFLNNINFSKFSEFSDNEIKEIYVLIEEVKKIINEFPLEIDYKKSSTINQILGDFTELTEIDESYERFRKIIYRQRDSEPRYEKLYNLLANNTIYIAYLKKMSDLELLEFITQYISAPLPPNIDQETFDDLVKAGIKEDDRESLWRLAFNYEDTGKDFDDIANYFIDKKDGYYLTDLVSAVSDDLSMEELIAKIIATKDVAFINDCLDRSQNAVFTEEEETKLKEGIVSM